MLPWNWNGVNIQFTSHICFRYIILSSVPIVICIRLVHTSTCPHLTSESWAELSRIGLSVELSLSVYQHKYTSLCRVWLSLYGPDSWQSSVLSGYDTGCSPNDGTPSDGCWSRKVIWSDNPTGNNYSWPSDVYTWGLIIGVMCQKHVSRAWASNYIPQTLQGVIPCPCFWYLLLAQPSLYVLATCVWMKQPFK